MHSYEHFWLDPKFWVAVSFTLFFVLFGAKIVKIVRDGLDARGTRIKADLEEAARLRTQAEAMLRQAEADRAAAAKEAEAMIARAEAEAKRIAESTAAEAAAAAARRERMAMDRIAAAEAAAVSEIRSAAAEIATAATRAVLAQNLDAAAGAALVDNAIADLPRALRAA
jgi:F-type H+-transporting ATPase subunit b